MPHSPRLLAIVCCVLALLSALRGQTPAPPAPCSLCTDGSVACPTCNGEGTRSIDCWHCGADGTLECARCATQPGSIDCPNPVCDKGQAKWSLGDRDPCKLCKAKGSVQCPECRGKKASPCTVCAGKGTRLRACWTCSGGKRIACPLCKPTVGDGCRSCDGTGRTACRLCPKEDNGTHICMSCNGTGGLICPTCHGLDRTPCKKCGASGKMRLASEKLAGAREKAGVKECEWCSGAGVTNCVDCKGGRRDCEACDKGRAPRSCTACLYVRTLPCEKCLSGGHATAEVLATYLVERGFPAGAISCLEHALAGVERMKGPRGETATAIEQFEDVARSQKKLEGLGAAAHGFPVHEGNRVVANKLEEWFPADLRHRHWPNPPAEHEAAPWLDDKWMAAHRQRTTERLQAALAKAREAAAAAGK